MEGTMLVLSRKEGEYVGIDGGIRIVIVKIKPDSVRIGIEAPAATQILRDDAVVRKASDG